MSEDDYPDNCFAHYHQAEVPENLRIEPVSPIEVVEHSLFC
jgi:hypothetical protein